MNNHSEKFLLVKNYYDAGFWKKKAVRNAVIKGWITEDEYSEITSEAHPEGAYSTVSGYPKTFDSRNYNATEQNHDGDTSSRQSY